MSLNEIEELKKIINDDEKYNNYLEIIKSLDKNNFKNILSALNKDDIEKIILILNHFYYQTKTSLISDFLFDKIITEFPYCQKEACLDDTNIIDLPIEMPSLQKYYPINIDKIHKEIYTFLTKQILITPKLDGLSCLLVCENKKLQLYTKGNGNKGRVISFLLDRINISSEAKNEIKKKNIILRGELIINKKYKNEFDSKKLLRNSVIGLVNQKASKQDPRQKYIDIVFYFAFYYKNLNFFTQLECIQKLKLNNIKFYLIEYPYDDIPEILKKPIKDEKYSDELIDELKNIYKYEIENYKYEIDGLVISDPKKKYKIKNNYIEKVFAFKENYIFCTTEITDIEWNISKNNTYIPKLIITPCSLGSTIVKKISGYNYNYVLTHGLGIGSEIIIKYGGNVIPVLHHVNKKSKKITIPQNSLVKGINLINSTISIEYVVKKIYLFYKGFKIKHIGEKSLIKVVNFLISKNIEIKNIFDYITAIKNTNIEEVGVSLNKKILESIKIFTHTVISIVDICIMLNKFKNIDSTKFLTIVKNYQYISEVFISGKGEKEIDQDKIENIKNVGEKTSKQFMKGLLYFIKNYEIINSFFNINYNIILEDKKFNVVFYKNKNHDFYFDKYRDYFNEMTKITKKTNIDYLIVENKNIESIQIDKAKSYNIKIITNKDFFKLLNEIVKKN